MSDKRWAPTRLAQGLDPGAIRLNDAQFALLLPVAEAVDGAAAVELLAGLQALNASVATSYDAFKAATTQLSAAVDRLEGALEAPLSSEAQEVALAALIRAGARGDLAITCSRSRPLWPSTCCFCPRRAGMPAARPWTEFSQASTTKIALTPAPLPAPWARCPPACGWARASRPALKNYPERPGRGSDSGRKGCPRPITRGDFEPRLGVFLLRCREGSMKASDLFVKCLEEEGVEYIFGVPGEENADFMMSLEQSEKIKFILCRHEQGASFMAEIYGRLTGEPAGWQGHVVPGRRILLPAWPMPTWIGRPCSC